MYKESEKNPSVWMDFSGIYESQKFYKDAKLYHMKLKNLSGTNCYCDDDAILELRKQMDKMTCHGIHFLDSGNYHYMTRIWLDKVEEPFDLLVFDNHTDLQPPAFGGILSCGGWIAASLEEIPFLKNVILIGPDENAFQMVDDEFKKRIFYRSREEMQQMNPECFCEWIKTIPINGPFYISVDKDVLSEKDLKTNWSQGDMRKEELLQYLSLFSDFCSERNMEILGMDVCGESEAVHPEMLEESDAINQSLLEYWFQIERRE